jgi:leader peptidase (prepilin peptidase) / N-methyltransferase
LSEIWALLFFIFGTLLGSFANVVILRLPKGESVLFPASHCYSCQKPVRWFDNIPVFSWLILRGKCRNCKVPFSVRYPLVELIMGLLFLIAFLQIGWSWFLIEALILIFGLVTISFIDLDHMIIPNVLSLPGVLIGLVGAAINPERTFLDGFLGFLVGGVFFFAIAYLYAVLRKREGLGGGDIKLLAWIGSVLGLMSIPFVVLVSSLTGIIAGLLTAFKSREGMQTQIPFGPYIALSALLYLFLSQSGLESWLLELYGLKPVNP